MRSYNLNEKIAPLKAVVLDVDGVLTPGGIWFTDRGDQLKRFDVKDGLGVVAMSKLGMTTAIITGKESILLAKRAGELRITDLYQGQPYKIPALEDFAGKHALNFEEIAFIGDDAIDVPAMDLCGFSACPSDAASSVKRAVDYVSRHPGGQGAIREIVEIIIAAKTGFYPPDEFFFAWAKELSKKP